MKQRELSEQLQNIDLEAYQIVAERHHSSAQQNLTPENALLKPGFLRQKFTDFWQNSCPGKDLQRTTRQNSLGHWAG